MRKSVAATIVSKKHFSLYCKVSMSWVIRSLIWTHKIHVVSYIPRASTNWSMTPPIWTSPLTRRDFSTWRSVTVMVSSQDPSTSPASDIILRPSSCVSEKSVIQKGTRLIQMQKFHRTDRCIMCILFGDMGMQTLDPKMYTIKCTAPIYIRMALMATIVLSTNSPTVNCSR